MNMVDERGVTPPPIKAIVIAVIMALLVMVVAVIGVALLVNIRANDAQVRADDQEVELERLANALNRAEVKDEDEAAYEEGLKRYICSLPAPPTYTPEQVHRRDQFCALPPQINIQRYLDEHS